MTIKKQVIAVMVMCGIASSSVYSANVGAKAQKYATKGWKVGKQGAEYTLVAAAAAVLAPKLAKTVRELISWHPKLQIEEQMFSEGDKPGVVQEVIDKAQSHWRTALSYVTSTQPWRELPTTLSAKAEEIVEAVWSDPVYFVALVAGGMWITDKGLTYFGLPGADTVHKYSPLSYADEVKALGRDAKNSAIDRWHNMRDKFNHKNPDGGNGGEGN